MKSILNIVKLENEPYTLEDIDLENGKCWYWILKFKDKNIYCTSINGYKHKKDAKRAGLKISNLLGIDSGKLEIEP